MDLKESQIEDVFEVFYKQLISPNLKLIARQCHLGNRLMADLLLKDELDRDVIVEIKRDKIKREDVGQALEYAGMVKDSRVILAAPFIASPIKKAFEHYGIDYLEFDISEISKLYDQIRDKPNKLEIAEKIKIVTDVVHEPLDSRRKRDGNIAFKVTYVDSNWSGVCSPRGYEYNKAHRRWCGIQGEYGYDCQKDYGVGRDVDEDNFPCFDSIALKTLRFSPGVARGDIVSDTPKRCLNAKVGKLALFTSIKPGETGYERFIFAVGRIEEFLTHEDFEMICCNKETALIFSSPNYPKFWDYYRNPNKPESKFWRTGLFRYIKDETANHLLQDVINDERFSDQKQAAKKLIEFVNEVQK